MNHNQTAVVKLIQAGTDPMVAVSEVYKTTPQAAQKRLTRILRHSQVYAALSASPVQTPQHPRRLMRGVYVALPGRLAPNLTDSKGSLGVRLNALLFEGAALTHDEWASLASDIRSSGFLGWPTQHSSDFHVLSSALCDQQEADWKINRERAYKHNEPRPHPEFAIPRDLMDKSDLEHEARCNQIWPSQPQG